jgi:ABC-type sugar transport system ATPase subunit
MASISLSGITKDYGNGVLAVDDLSLEIHDGEFLVLLGPSGCGKSTALRMIAGLEQITSGELRIGQVLMNEVEARDRNISMVFQSYALYPHMTVRRNIQSPLMVREMYVDGPDKPPRRLSKAEMNQRVEQVAESLGLTDYLSRKPGALSGGQRQRVALARAIVARPSAYLMDEPLSNLDAKLRTQTRAELIELHRSLATTIVYVTHDQIEAMTMASRIAIMKAGKLQQVGTPQEVYDRPANDFVAGFIGTPPMNFFGGTVRAGGFVEAEGGSIRLPEQLSGLQPGRSVKVGIRPEHLVAVEDGIPAVVSTVEWLGPETIVGCVLAEGPDPDARVMVRHSGASPAAVGEQWRLGASPELVHVFDAETGARLQ